jgi:hypothetical protein
VANAVLNRITEAIWAAALGTAALAALKNGRV